MKHLRIYVGCLASIVFAFSGCCVSYSLRIKNKTEACVVVTAEDMHGQVGIPAGKTKELPYLGGRLEIDSPPTTWVYPNISFGREATKRVFRFRVCGFGYLITPVTLDSGGRLVIGKDILRPQFEYQHH